MVLPVEVVNETIAMDTPQQEASEAINSFVTKVSSDCEHTTDNFKDDGDIMSEETACSDRSGCEVVTVNCDKCGKDISIDVWIEHEDYHVAAKLQDTFNRTPIKVPSVPTPSSSSQQSSRKTTPTKSSKRKLSTQVKLSHKSKKPQSSTLDKFLKKST